MTSVRLLAEGAAFGAACAGTAVAGGRADVAAGAAGALVVGAVVGGAVGWAAGGAAVGAAGAGAQAARSPRPAVAVIAFRTLRRTRREACMGGPPEGRVASAAMVGKRLASVPR